LWDPYVPSWERNDSQLSAIRQLVDGFINTMCLSVGSAIRPSKQGLDGGVINTSHHWTQAGLSA